jgi:chromosome segregation ATPase
MTAEQIANKLMEHTKEIAALWESSKSAHKRHDDNGAVITGIHELAKSVASMATEIRLLTERFDKSVERIERGQAAQGERIGKIEKSVSQIERNEKDIAKYTAKIEAIEKEPADKWKKFMWLVFAAIVGAVIAFIMARLL